MFSSKTRSPFVGYLFFSILVGLVASASTTNTPLTAVVVLKGDSSVTGTVTFQQSSESSLIRIRGTISGLTPRAQRGFHVHEFGNLTAGCTSTGAHFNPFRKNHGAPTDKERHVGDLGNVISDGSGVAKFDFTDSAMSLFGEHSIIGRGLVIHNGTDDLGQGGTPDSLTTGNSGSRLACGVIGIA